MKRFETAGMTRRQFLGGLAGTSLGAFFGCRFAFAAPAAALRPKPRLRFGVLSDVGSHWDSDLPKGKYMFARIEDWLAAHGKKLDPMQPFFYVQHPHLKDTCYGSWAWGHDKGIATRALSASPNAIAFSGHSHYPLTDERSIWQGAFTSVGENAQEAATCQF